MALDIDGYAVLAAVTTVPEVFPDIRADIAKTARALVVKQLKARTMALRRLRLIRKTLGVEAFVLILDGMTDTEIKGLVARFDKHHPELRTASAEWYRLRLSGLADAEMPVEKTKAAAAGAADKPKVARALGKRPFAAAWDGKDHDAPAKAKRKKKG